MTSLYPALSLHVLYLQKRKSGSSSPGQVAARILNPETAKGPSPGLVVCRGLFLRVWMRKVPVHTHLALTRARQGSSTLGPPDRARSSPAVGAPPSPAPPTHPLLLPCPRSSVSRPTGLQKQQAFFFLEGSGPLRLQPPWVDKGEDVPPDLESAKEIRGGCAHEVTRLHPRPPDLLPVRRGYRKTSLSC